jgi:hypothetical protein
MCFFPFADKRRQGVRPSYRSWAVFNAQDETRKGRAGSDRFPARGAFYEKAAYCTKKGALGALKVFSLEPGCAFRPRLERDQAAFCAAALASTKSYFTS